MPDVIYAQSNPHDAVGVATLVSGVLAENNVSTGDGIAGLMIVLMAAVRPDLNGVENVGPFLHDISIAMASWMPPAKPEATNGTDGLQAN